MAPLVLVVDDDDDILNVLCLGLELNGYRVVTADHAARALQCIETERPDLLLLDVHMPVADGPWLAQELRRRGQELPIIAMTSDPDPAGWATRMGAVAWIAKPFALPDILGRVEAYTSAA
jgi:CheY-like chemotaxis protein